MPSKSAEDKGFETQRRIACERGEYSLGEKMDLYFSIYFNSAGNGQHY